ncbi:translation initiation factor IF-2-like isoform X2 [Aquila chrysaetos chrysaetos]|uniref:translation initiation factor IF-2-like isoform X2 n=1 Tax=Aquila chrysaetos chrysaetos TaxID=223781 RepID=UPI001B7D37AC|nr:translation initiation factor IF-2-like isoform X2 [Aquila chrysaetos chrysaetos]
MAAVTCAAAHPPHTTTTPPSPGPVPDAARAGRPAQLPRGARPPFSRSARGPARPAAPAGLRAGGGKPLASPGSAAVPRGPLPPPPARGRRRRPAATRERSLSRPEPAARSGRPRGRRAPALPVPVGRRGTWRLRLRARLPAGSLQVWEPAFLCGNVSSSSWDLLSACTRLGQSSRSPVKVTSSQTLHGMRQKQDFLACVAWVQCDPEIGVWESHNSENALSHFQAVRERGPQMERWLPYCG